MLEADDLKRSEMKENIKKEYKRRVRKVLETKLNGHNLIKAINTFFFYKSIKFYNTYYGLHYLQELLYNTTGTNTPGEQKAVSTPRELTKIKERKLLKLNQHY